MCSLSAHLLLWKRPSNARLATPQKGVQTVAGTLKHSLRLLQIDKSTISVQLLFMLHHKLKFFLLEKQLCPHNLLPLQANQHSTSQLVTCVHNAVPEKDNPKLLLSSHQIDIIFLTVVRECNVPQMKKQLHSTQSTKLTSTQHHDSAEACEDKQFQFKTLLHPACSKQVRVPGTLFERRVTRIIRACVHAMTPALIQLVSQFSSQSQVQTTTMGHPL